jgi:sec-independent protein translocase protein TatA
VPSIGTGELIIILLILLLIFGGAKLPKLARSLGQAQSEFKKGVGDSKQDEVADASPDPDDSSTA